MASKVTSNNYQSFSDVHTFASQAQWQSLSEILLLTLKSNDPHDLELLQSNLLKGEGPLSWTPLMLSCARAPPKVIALLLKCCPLSCTIADKSGSFPLHFASSWRRVEDDDELIDMQIILKMLLNVSPESVSVQNQWGCTPLHAVFDGEELPSVGVIKILLGLSNMGRHDNDNGNSLSNSSLNTFSSEDDQLLEMNDWCESEETRIKLRFHVRAALSTPDAKSQLPLHLAAAKGASEEILRMLVSIYREAATITTIGGDLPLHLLQYYAEDVVDTAPIEKELENETSVQDLTLHASKKNSQRILQARIYSAISVGQVEALLEPLCVGFEGKLPPERRISAVGTILGTDAVGVKENGNLKSISERDEEDTENERSADHSKMRSFNSLSSKGSTHIPVPPMIATACLSSGSRGLQIPIHIAADHGVSFQILFALCEQHPESVAMPRSKEVSKEVFDGSEEDSSDQNDSNTKHLEAYPIEIFENGRSRWEAEKATLMWNWHSANLNNSVITNEPSNVIDINWVEVVLQRFHARSDLLFAFYPEAMRFSESNAERKDTILYRKDPHRLNRLESLIKEDAVNCTAINISTTARLVWLWMCKTAKYSDNPSDKGIYQACVGRIIAGLLDSALWKLGYILKAATKKQNSLLSGSTDRIEEIEEHISEISFAQLGSFINEKNIKEEALEREPKLTLEEMLDFEDKSWHFTVIDFLTGHDGLNYSIVCKRTRHSGLRLLNEIYLGETGRTWNLPPCEELSGCEKSELWQELDDYLQQRDTTHLVYVTYYLEVSEGKGSSILLPGRNKRNSTNTKSVSGRRKGGLLVLSKNLRDGGTKLETKEQKKVILSKISTPEGCEVRLCFKYKPTNSYSLHVYGPFCGGRVSISNARIRQLVHASNRNTSPSKSVELCSLNPSLSMQVTTLSSTQFHSTGELALHRALEDGLSIDILSAIIASKPSSLLEVDDEGRTALHKVFCLPQNKPPSLSVIKTLLTSPGENATKIKDSHMRLPLHIASGRGAYEAILRLLVEAYTDGCYRINKDGDLPIHLLVRSGRAITASVELLIRPIVDNETICKKSGSRGYELPLHIAAEYNCSYKVLESLLLTYGKAASIQRERPDEDGDTSTRCFALELLEQLRSKVVKKKPKPSSTISESAENLSCQNPHPGRQADQWHLTEFTTFLEPMRSKVVKNVPKTPSTISDSAESFSPENSRPFRVREAAKFDMTEADFNLRSDLLFVFNPIISPVEGIVYRKDTNRIQRIQNLIRREAIACVGRKKINIEAGISEMARMGWHFFCTYHNPNDPHDHYAEQVANILRGLSRSIVQILADYVSNPSSTSGHMQIADCAIPLCRQLILSRMQFVGRYVLEDDDCVIHESDGSLVIGAKDYGLVERYRKIISLLRTEGLPDIDDLPSITGSIANTVLSGSDEIMELFINFALELGFDKEGAKCLFDKYFVDQDAIKLNVNEGGESTSGIKSDHNESKFVETFQRFCLSHKINEAGARSTIIKFMKHRSQFVREKAIRARLDFVEEDFAVFPIIDDYDIGRIDDSCEGRPTMSPYEIHWKSHDSKDALFKIDVHEKKYSKYNFSFYKYAIVMPRGDKTLSEIMLHEERDVLKVREHLYQIGTALQQLHRKFTIHGDLNLSNIVRYGSHLALIDLDSSSSFDTIGDSDTQIEAIGGASQKCCFGIMPPELIAKIDLFENGDHLKSYNKYWKHVIDDAEDMKLLNRDNIRKITATVKTLVNQSEAVKAMGSAITSLRTTMKDPLPGLNDPCTNWQDVVSESLIDLSFELLPDSLISCETIEQFTNVWARMKVNAQLWEKIQPQISADGRYAYMVKCYDNLHFALSQEEVTRISNSLGLLPYDLVQASEKYDVWSFGVMMFFVCSGISLFHLSYNGQLCNFSAYEDLHNWNSTVAKQKIVNYIDDPLAQDLLMKVLSTEGKRLSDMELVLQHPFFGKGMGSSTRQILEEYEKQKTSDGERNMTSNKGGEQVACNYTEKNQVNWEKFLCMEKYCMQVFDIQEGIFVPTSFIILPYKLERSSSSHLEAPKNISSLAVGEKVGKYLLDMNTATAKLFFWLRMKLQLSEKNGMKYKTRIKVWLQRARTESSQDIAKEIIASIELDKSYEGICVEMLDEGLSISNADSFIKDPWKAATKLFKEAFNELLKLYPQNRAHALYLIDEWNSTVILPDESSDNIQNIYPIEVEKMSEFKDVLFPFINITVMSVTTKYGMEGLARLLGLPSTYGIPDLWKDSSIGFVHAIKESGSSSIPEFARLQQILVEDNASFPNTDYMSEDDFVFVNSTSFRIEELEDFYYQFDANFSFCGLNRLWNKDDDVYVWTTKETIGQFEKTPFQAELKLKIENKSKRKEAHNLHISSNHGLLNGPIVESLPQWKENPPQSSTGLVKEVPVTMTEVNPPTSCTPTTIPSTVPTNSTLDRHNALPGNPLPVVTKSKPTSLQEDGYIFRQVPSKGVRRMYESLPPMSSHQNEGYFSNQDNPSMVSNVMMRKQHPTPSDITDPSSLQSHPSHYVVAAKCAKESKPSSIVSHSILGKHLEKPSCSVRLSQPSQIFKSSEVSNITEHTEYGVVHKSSPSINRSHPSLPLNTTSSRQFFSQPSITDVSRQIYHPPHVSVAGNGVHKSNISAMVPGPSSERHQVMPSNLANSTRLSEHSQTNMVARQNHESSFFMVAPKSISNRRLEGKESSSIQNIDHPAMVWKNTMTKNSDQSTITDLSLQIDPSYIARSKPVQRYPDTNMIWNSTPLNQKEIPFNKVSAVQSSQPFQITSTQEFSAPRSEGIKRSGVVHNFGINRDHPPMTWNVTSDRQHYESSNVATNTSCQSQPLHTMTASNFAQKPNTSSLPPKFSTPEMHQVLDASDNCIRSQRPQMLIGTSLSQDPFQSLKSQNLTFNGNAQPNASYYDSNNHVSDKAFLRNEM